MMVRRLLTQTLTPLDGMSNDCTGLLHSFSRCTVSVCGGNGGSRRRRPLGCKGSLLPIRPLPHDRMFRDGDPIIHDFSMPNGRNIETQDEWLQRHKSKFDNARLSRAERLRRYRDYASSQSGAAHSTRTVSTIYREPAGSSRSGDERYELLKAMMDPFTACSAEGHLPRVPDGTTKHTGLYKFKFNVDVISDANGRAFVFVDACPFRTYAVSLGTSAIVAGDPVAQAGFVASAEYNAFAVAISRLSNNVGSMPSWTEGSWSIPSVRTQNVATTPGVPGSIEQGLADMQPCTGYSSLWDLAQAWRPVCCGMKFQNTSKVLDRQGSVAVARWPGALGIPTTANQLLVVDSSSTTSAAQAAFAARGPNFNTVQTLPTCEVMPVVKGFSCVWAPESTVGQAKWRPIHPKPICTQGTYEAFEAYSDEINTGVFILPDPCNGDPDRYEALLDRVYSQNAAVVNTTFLNQANGTSIIAPQYYGSAKGLYFQEFANSAALPDPATEEANATISSYAARDLVKSFNDTNKMVDDTCLVACFEGCDPNTLLGTLEICLGVEYIADSRIVSTGNGPSVGKLAMPKSKQLDLHHATIEAISHVPTVVDQGVSFVEGVASALPRIASAASAIAPYAEAAFAALGALL